MVRSIRVITRPRSHSSLQLHDAVWCIGADHFVVSSDPASVTARKGTLDLILNTVPTYHDYVYYQTLLTTKGVPHLNIVLGVLIAAILS